MAPTSSILAHSHTRSLDIGSKCRNTCIMAGGRLRMAPPFLVDRFESSVSCFLFLVYQMDKVELRFTLIRCEAGSYLPHTPLRREQDHGAGRKLSNTSQ